ncbi:MAG: hypothetical protein RRC34_02825 [Lentisphaeria bacterium]|nr:hypothetical protein [Lentisphaeria bacterium]
MSQDVRELKQEVHKAIKDRIGKAEDAIQTIRNSCQGSTVGREIKELKARQAATDSVAHQIDSKLAALGVTMTNVTSALRDQQTDLKRYVEETTRQDERINNIGNRVDGLHGAFRGHTNDRGIHHG